MKTLRIISRYLIGLTFIFSGFVKGQDPLGTSFRIEDYFIAYGMNWALPAALFLSILLCAAEFGLGWALIWNALPRVTTYLVTAMMSFFTLVTLYDAIYNPVPDCGCFGDAIKLTNIETFLKNVVLMIFVVVLLVTRKKESPKWKQSQQIVIAAIGILIMTSTSLYAYQRLPLIDFMDWKVGKNMYPSTEVAARYYVTYKNNTTGETKEYESNAYPYNDSVWLSQWSFVSTRIDDPSAALRHQLQLVDMSGGDVTDSYLKGGQYQLIATVWDEETLKGESMDKLIAIGKELAKHNCIIAVASPVLPEEAIAYNEKHENMFDMLSADDIVLKTMVRANPGVILMHQGIVIDKWNLKSLPDAEELIKRWPGLDTSTQTE